MQDSDSPGQELQVKEVKRKRGRPRKGMEKAQRTWQPKKWKPEYENICNMFYVLGLDQSIIAERTGFTKEHVNNIVNSEKGKIYSDFIVKKLREKTTGDTLDRLARLQDNALSRIEDTLSRGDIYEANPISVARLAKEILQDNGVIKNAASESRKNETNINNSPGGNINVLVTDPDIINQLKSGLDKSLEAAKLYDQKKLLNAQNAELVE